MTKDDVVKEFTKIKGVGKAKAEQLYEKGFTTMDKLKKAKVEDLTKIDGINKQLAKDITNQFKTTKKQPVKKPTEKKTTTSKTKTIPKETKKKEDKKPKEKTIKDKKEIEKEEELEEEKEEKYQVKKKPKISEEKIQKLKVRKQIKNRTPEFLREEWFRYKRIPKNWRRPDGITSKMRRNYKYRPSKVRIGFRGPKEVRGLHPSGFEEIMVYNTNDLINIDPKIQAARIGSTVGTKKRLEIEKKAEKLEIRILNK